jgi:hypothetical protein
MRVSRRTSSTTGSDGRDLPRQGGRKETRKSASALHARLAQRVRPDDDPGGDADGGGVRWVEARPWVGRAGPGGRGVAAGDGDRRAAEVAANTGGTDDAGREWLALRLRNGRELRFDAAASTEAVRRWAEVLEQDARPC